MLSTSNTEAMRQQVVAQEQADNQALAAVCAALPAATGKTSPAISSPSRLPISAAPTMCHPNMEGQNDIAEVTWAAGLCPSAPQSRVADDRSLPGGLVAGDEDRIRSDRQADARARRMGGRVGCGELGEDGHVAEVDGHAARCPKKGGGNNRSD